MLFSRNSGSRDKREPEAPVAPEVTRLAAEPGRHASSDVAPTQSFIDSSLTIVGDLHTEGDMQVDGRICGNVSCAQLIVGSGAAITGTVKAEHVIARGAITGTIHASVVILQDTARVKSDIVYTQIAIDDGAIFEGAVRRSETPLEEPDTASALRELERLVATDGSGESAGSGERLEPKGREPDGASGAGVVPPTPERRNANGHADAPR